MSENKAGTLGQALEQAVDSWVNHEFPAVVTGVTSKPTKNNSTMFLATLSDPDSPGISCEFTIFGRKAFDFEGCLCTFSGQGMKLGEYKGRKKIQGSEKTTINKLGQAPANSLPAQRAASASNGAPPAGGSASVGGGVHGQTVGMAMNNAVAIVRECLMPTDLAAAIKYVDSSAFSRDVYTIASDLLRVSEMLQKGKLADSAKERAASPEDKAAAAKAKAEAEAKAKADEEAKKAAEQKRLEEEARKGNQSKAGSEEDFGDVPF